MWRHVIKSLSLLDYLIKNGSERVVDYANRHLAEIKTLKVQPIPIAGSARRPNTAADTASSR